MAGGERYRSYPEKRSQNGLRLIPAASWAAQFFMLAGWSSPGLLGLLGPLLGGGQEALGKCGQIQPLELGELRELSIQALEQFPLGIIHFCLLSCPPSRPVVDWGQEGGDYNG